MGATILASRQVPSSGGGGGAFNMFVPWRDDTPPQPEQGRFPYMIIGASDINKIIVINGEEIDIEFDNVSGSIIVITQYTLNVWNYQSFNTTSMIITPANCFGWLIEVVNGSLSNVLEISSNVPPPIAEQFMCTTSDYNLLNQTALQKMLNGTNVGSVWLTGERTYFFECSFDINIGDVASLPGVGFGFLGSATFTSIRYTFSAIRGSNTTYASGGTNTYTGSSVSAALTYITATGGNQRGCSATIRGIIRTNQGGSLIPSIGFSSLHGSSILKGNAYFRILEVGQNTIVSKGAWG